MATKLWGGSGHFSKEQDSGFFEFNKSIGVDRTLWRVDLQCSIAWAEELAKSGVITGGASIVAGLRKVHQEWDDGKFAIAPTDEDIHTANERRLTELIGPTAGQLHTGRSRNDQVATDLRLWLREEIAAIKRGLLALLQTGVTQAENTLDVIMPGYTHLQPAQPVRMSHWLLSHAASWRRDLQRLDELARRVNIMPLGSGALAGTPFPVDRKRLAGVLGFEFVSENSIDAVSDRDFVAEALFWASLAMTHMSQLAEDLILFHSQGLVSISDAFVTGSSLMPQKKNPDALELLRGKTGRALGNLVSMITTLKALPRAYNKDLQEDKPALFDSVRQVRASLGVLQGVLATLTVNRDAVKAELEKHPEMFATDLADFLVRAGVPFRDAHKHAGEAVALAEKAGCKLTELTREQLKTVHLALDSDGVKALWDWEASVERRSACGGTGKASQLAQIELLKVIIATSLS